MTVEEFCKVFVDGVSQKIVIDSRFSKEGILFEGNALDAQFNEFSERVVDEVDASQTYCEGIMIYIKGN